MWHKVKGVTHHVFQWRSIVSEEALAFVIALLLFGSPVSAAMRLQERSLLIDNSEPGATTAYTVSFKYMSPQIIGSVDLLVCVDPIPYHPCVKPANFDASNAFLTDQTGENDFSILSKSSNHIVLSRLPTMVTANNSSYRFTNITNPTAEAESYSIRIRTHASTDATGPLIDFGSVKAQVQTGIQISTQVPPMLIFCAAEQVSENCVTSNENYYTDMGELTPSSTLIAQSQMAVGTNASGGFAVTANGVPMSAGTNVIDGPTTPTESLPGSNQFGINLVANNLPAVGQDPEGAWQNAFPSPDYSEPNKYKYISGDVVAYSPNVSLMKKFTVSYVVNSAQNLRPGVYSTTITYVATGRF